MTLAKVKARSAPLLRWGRVLDQLSWWVRVLDQLTWWGRVLSDLVG